MDVRRHVALTALLLAMGGCQSWQLVLAPPADVLRHPPPSRIRAVLTSGDTLEQHVRLMDDSVYGTTRVGLRLSAPLSAVADVEVLRFDRWRTVGATLEGAALVLAWLYLHALTAT